MIKHIQSLNLSDYNTQEPELPVPYVINVADAGVVKYNNSINVFMDYDSCYYFYVKYNNSDELILLNNGDRISSENPCKIIIGSEINNELVSGSTVPTAVIIQNNKIIDFFNGDPSTYSWDIADGDDFKEYYVNAIKSYNFNNIVGTLSIYSSECLPSSIFNKPLNIDGILDTQNIYEGETGGLYAKLNGWSVNSAGNIYRNSTADGKTYWFKYYDESNNKVNVTETTILDSAKQYFWYAEDTEETEEIIEEETY